MAAGKWIPSWRVVPIDYNHEIARFHGTTQRCCFVNNLSGDRVRLRLCNLFNDVPMSITCGRIAVRNRVSGRRSDWMPLTLNGEREIILPPDSACCSDELALTVSAEDDFLVDLYFEKELSLRGVCISWSKQSWQSAQYDGDYRKGPDLGLSVARRLAPELAQDSYDNQYLVGFSEIQVRNRDGAKLLALFGDSITHMGYYDDVLTGLLYERFPGKIAVMNAGIGGNRIARNWPRVDMPGGGTLFGEAGKKRIRRDLFEGASPDWVFLLEGVNDCTHAFAFGETSIPTAEEIYGALDEAAGITKAQGARVCVSTIMPFGCFSEPWRDRAEELRQRCNALIRAGGSWDRLIDLDAVMRDPDNEHLLQAGMDLGDGIHPGPMGGKKIAQTIYREGVAK